MRRVYYVPAVFFFVSLSLSQYFVWSLWYYGFLFSLCAKSDSTLYLTPATLFALFIY